MKTLTNHGSQIDLPQNPPYASRELLAGLSLLTIIMIRNRGEQLVAAARLADNGKYQGASWLANGMMLCSTKPEFESEEEGTAYMRSVVTACREYMAEQDRINRLPANADEADGMQYPL